MVVADTVWAAKQGAELVEVDHEPLPCVTDTVAAARQDAPRVYDEARSNVCFDAQLGDAAATAAAFASAAHVTKFETWVQRVTGVPMEPRAVLAAYDPDTGRYTVHAGNGGAVRLKVDLATMLGVAAGKSPRADAGRRRQFRHARHDLRRIRAGRLGGAASRPAGEMDQRAPRVVPQRLPGARPRGRGRACARCKGKFPGDARLQSRQPRRPHHQFLDGAEGRRDHVEHLSHADRAFPRPRDAQQYLADAALSQRRPAGSDLRHGAADRPCGAAMRLRSRRHPPAQSADGQGNAVPEPVRHGIRQRRLRSSDGAGADARRLEWFSSAAA